MLKNTFVRKGIYAVGTLLLTGAVFLSGLMLVNAGIVVRGVTVGNVAVGGSSWQGLEEVLRKETEQFEKTPIPLILPDGSRTDALPAVLGVALDIAQTKEYAFTAGKARALPFNALAQLGALFAGVRLPAQGTVHKETLEQFVQSSLVAFHLPAQNASLVYDPEKEIFVAYPEKKGVVIDLVRLREQLQARIAHLSSDPIELIQKNDTPAITLEGAEEARKNANKYLENLPTLTYEDGSWAVEKEDLAAWISFAPDAQNAGTLAAYVETKYMEEYLTALAPGMNREPVDARFAMQNDRVVTFQLAVSGRELEIKESARHIQETLESISPGVPGTAGEIPLIFKEKEAAITSEKIDQLGITTLLARGETNFAGSPKNRMHNISVGANKMQGLLIAPGEEFSFNEKLGEVDAASGFLPELVIKKGKTTPEYGGGLCQVSTTLYRAAVYGGLEIKERYPHAYAVRYYGTPGFDATIYPPHPDLRFKNNTSGYILVQEKIQGTKLIFELYGTKDGRTVEVKGPYLYDQQPDGAVKAKLSQKVLAEDGSVLLEKTFYSNYKSPELYPIERSPYE